MSFEKTLNYTMEMYEGLQERRDVKILVSILTIVLNFASKDYFKLILLPFSIFSVFFMLSRIIRIRQVKNLALFSFIMFFHSVLVFSENRLEFGKQLSWSITLIYTSYEIMKIGYLTVSYNLWIKQVNHYFSLWYFGNRFVMPRYYGMLIILKFNLFVYSFIFKDKKKKKSKYDDKKRIKKKSLEDRNIVEFLTDVYYSIIEDYVDDEDEDEEEEKEKED